MNYSDSGISGIAGLQAGEAPESRFKSPMAKAAQQSSEEAMQFQLWVSQQATSLAKLKVFHSMAKQVNDQQ